jgi:hypothetical protein
MAQDSGWREVKNQMGWVWIMRHAGQFSYDEPNLALGPELTSKRAPPSVHER